MNVYEVQKIKMEGKWYEYDTFVKLLKETPTKRCIGLKEVFDYCGGKLKRERNGYAGTVGNYSCCAFRVS